MMQTPVVVAKPVLDSKTKQQPIAQFLEIAVPQPNTQHANKNIKALVDYLVIVPTLLLIWPLMVVLIIAVWLDSPGPVFYRRRVLGKNGRVFHALKFRTMFNILLQDMSVVGPRIITPEEVEKYGDNGDQLISVMPGLTGLWQISGRSNTSYDERVTLDMTYIQTWSVWQDVKILFKTVPAVLKGDGAY